jgi:hypothetical protein
VVLYPLTLKTWVAVEMDVVAEFLFIYLEWRIPFSPCMQRRYHGNARYSTLSFGGDNWASPSPLGIVQVWVSYWSSIFFGVGISRESLPAVISAGREVASTHPHTYSSPYYSFPEENEAPLYWSEWGRGPARAPCHIEGFIFPRPPFIRPASIC